MMLLDGLVAFGSLCRCRGIRREDEPGFDFCRTWFNRHSCGLRGGYRPFSSSIGRIDTSLLGDLITEVCAEITSGNLGMSIARIHHTRQPCSPSSSDRLRIDRILTTGLFARGKTRYLVSARHTSKAYKTFCSRHSSDTSSSVRSSSYCKSARMPFRHSSPTIAKRADSSTCAPEATYTSHR